MGLKRRPPRLVPLVSRSELPRTKSGRIHPHADNHLWKLSLLFSFVERHGLAALKRQTIVPPGVKLYLWVRRRREAYWEDTIDTWLARELERIPGWSWKPLTRLERNVERMKRFVDRYGWDLLDVETRFEGVLIHAWVKNQRGRYSRGELTPTGVHLIETIPGWTWSEIRTRHRENLSALRAHVERHGWAGLSHRKATYEARKLAVWATAARSRYHHKRIDDWLRQQLEAIPGWTWTPDADHAQRNLELLRAYVATHGWDGLSSATVFRGVKLGSWFIRICVRPARTGELPRWLRRELEQIAGWKTSLATRWLPTHKAPGVAYQEETVHDRNVRLLRRFVREHGWDAFGWHTQVDGVKLGHWLDRVRRRYRRGELSPHIRREMEAILGWSSSSLTEQQHRQRMDQLRAFVAAHGWHSLNSDTVVGDTKLGSWFIRNCVRRARLGTLPRWMRTELAQIPGWQRSLATLWPRVGTRRK